MDNNNQQPIREQFTSSQPKSSFANPRIQGAMALLMLVVAISAPNPLANIIGSVLMVVFAYSAIGSAIDEIKRVN